MSPKSHSTDTRTALIAYYNLPFVGLDVPGDMASEDESGGDKPDRHKRTEVGQLGKRRSSPCRSEAQSQRAYPRHVFVPLKQKFIKSLGNPCE